jgi:hypothetical protein
MSVAGDLLGGPVQRYPNRTPPTHLHTPRQFMQDGTWDAWMVQTCSNQISQSTHVSSFYKGACLGGTQCFSHVIHMVGHILMSM